MKKLILPAVAAGLFLAALTASAAVSFGVKPGTFDPSKTKLVAGQWIAGIGCPKGATVEQFVPPDYTTTQKVPFTDPACTTGDSDRNNEGLLLAKTGPTNNNAAAAASLTGIKKGTLLTELGYDLRKSGGSTAGVAGSHCGAGAPRFNIVLNDDPDNLYMIGCNTGTVTASSDGWLRLRWSGGTLNAYQNGVTLVNIANRPIKSIDIIMDEGQDATAGPDMFGLVVLDNIDFNATLVGRATDVKDDRDRDNDRRNERNKKHKSGHDYDWDWRRFDND